MNIQERDILLAVAKDRFTNQRLLAEKTGYSLGKVNSVLKSLINEAWIQSDYRLTEKAEQELNRLRPERAVILAAGAGMRMVPINTQVTKGLIEVRGETLIERLINQLHEAGVHQIDVVVGFMKEQYEFLIDRYNVNLIYNSQYDVRNNLYSLLLALKEPANTYIVPCDIRCETNPFAERELYSWYMVSDRVSDESYVRVNRKKELVETDAECGGNAMIGIAYVTADDMEHLKRRMEEMNASKRYWQSFWEDAVMKSGKMKLAARVVSHEDYFEINTYEQLRDLDKHSGQLESDILELIAAALRVGTNEISEITLLKKGMTNRSFKFRCRDKYYIMRIPGEGTDKMINREQEFQVYQTIRDLQICDPVIYMNPENGYKITEFMEESHNCDAENPEEVQECMRRLRQFHSWNLKTKHTFDIYERMEYYEKLWEGQPSVYRDYKATKEKMYELKAYIDAQKKEWVLTHIDAVPDNFLFTKKGIRLIDWEYAGMQDPHVDIAMFAIYALYDRKQTEALIDMYFPEGCAPSVRLKIYCYIAACGLLWSNWCEYKSQLGVEFGEYALKQYRYAKDYYRIFHEEREKYER